MNKEITASASEEIKKFLEYDPETGVITWKVSRGGRARAGSVAGTPHSEGYIHIGVSGKYYKAHRLAWFLHYGVWPTDQIDHINGVRNDNRIANLREATHSNNQRNCGKYANNTSGYKGVCWDKGASKWQARCQVDGKNHRLGYYSTAELAHEAYCKFAAEYHEEFFNAG